MFVVQVHCACGYTVRFTGEDPAEFHLGPEAKSCPWCTRDLLIADGLLQTHPVIRYWGEDAQADWVKNVKAPAPMHWN